MYDMDFKEYVMLRRGIEYKFYYYLKDLIDKQCRFIIYYVKEPIEVFLMIYLPNEWLVNPANEERVRELLDELYSDLKFEDSITEEEVIKELGKMDEHIIIDKHNSNLIASTQTNVRYFVRWTLSRLLTDNKVIDIK